MLRSRRVQFYRPEGNYPHYQFDRRFRGPQSQSERSDEGKKTLPQPDIEPRSSSG